MRHVKILFVFMAFIILCAGAYKTGFINYWEPAPDHFADPFDESTEWGPTQTVTAFFPGQASLQWLTGIEGHGHPVAGEGSRENHPGFAQNHTIEGTQSCQGCHSESLYDFEFAAGLVDEAKGVEGKDPFKEIDLQAAFDDDFLYIKASWETQSDRPGITHGTFQYRDGDWHRNTTNKTSDKNQPGDLGNNEVYSYEDRFAVMMAPKDLGDEIRAFGNEGVSFNDGGCFIACHSGMREMPERPLSAEVENDPWLGDAGLGNSDIRHYLLHTRNVTEFADATADGNWKTDGTGYDQNQQIDDFKDGNFLDLWQFRGARSAPMFGSSNDAVLEYRHSGLADNSRGDNYWFNQNPAGTQPANADELVYNESTHQWEDGDQNVVDVTDYNWMYDESITGFHALPGTAIDASTGTFDLDQTAKYPLITRGPDRNAVPLNMDMINENDFLPRRTLREGTGIRGALTTYSSWDENNNRWTVLFRRALNTDPCDHGDYGDWCSDHKITVGDLLSTGQGVTMAFAIFDDHSSNRYHHVTFTYVVQDHEEADIQAYNNSSFTSVSRINKATNAGLDQNYPNPFSGITEIPFSLTEGMDVTISVYDIHGRKIETLVDGFKSAGEHTVQWEAHNLTNGVYFYTIEAGQYTQTKRALLLTN